MSTDPTAPSSTSRSNFASIFNASLESYKRRTKNDLASHPLLPALQSCESPEGVLAVLREQVPAFDESQSCEDGLTKWVTPTVNVLYSFSGAVGQGVGLVNIQTFLHGEFLPNIYLQAFPPTSVIFAGIGVLLSVGFPASFCRAIYFDIELRRLKMRAPAKKSLSTALTALDVSSFDLRYILALHQPRL